MDRTKAIMGKINLAVVISTSADFDEADKALLDELKARGAKSLLVFNKIDLFPVDEGVADSLKVDQIPFIAVSCLTGENIGQARNRMVEIAKTLQAERSTIVGDIIDHGELVLLVVPIDLGAPKGRLILPQVQVIRDILDNDAVAMVVKEREIEYILSSLKTPPGLVICNSQVVLKVAATCRRVQSSPPFPSCSPGSRAICLNSCQGSRPSIRFMTVTRCSSARHAPTTPCRMTSAASRYPGG